jgi:hypothetical protein
MWKEKSRSKDVEKSERQPCRVHLPGFLTEEEVGLGDVIKHVTYTVGIKPCESCERRAATLNRWFVFTGRAKY